MAGVRRMIALSAVAFGLLAGPAAASADVLYDQTSSPGAPNTNFAAPNFSPSNDFGSSGSDRLADDFTVPVGKTWSVNEVDVQGAYSGTPGNLVNVFLYSDAAGKPGAEVFHQLAIAAPGGPNYAVPLTGAPDLSAGTYWIAVQQTGSSSGSFIWTWTTRTSVSGNASEWFAASSSGHGQTLATCPLNTWAPRLSCWPGTNPDQLFMLKGTDVTPVVTPPSNVIKLGKLKLNKKAGTAVEPVTVPDAGVLSLTGPGLSAQHLTAGGPGTLKLKLKPKGKAKKKLKKSGKAKAKLTISFTPTGGTLNSVTKTVTLKKKLN